MRVMPRRTRHSLVRDWPAVTKRKCGSKVRKRDAQLRLPLQSRSERALVRQQTTGERSISAMRRLLKSNPGRARNGLRKKTSPHPQKLPLPKSKRSSAAGANNSSPIAIFTKTNRPKTAWQDGASSARRSTAKSAPPRRRKNRRVTALPHQFNIIVNRQSKIVNFFCSFPKMG